MNYDAVIGLEIHVEMKTKSKMFSSAPVEFGAQPNTLVAPLDMAFPGTMPVVNKQAVINAIRVSNALNMQIDDTLYFDRKNYFYSDLPKGYQITQNARPIGREGYLDIDTSRGRKHIRIERLHMEEDTCKQIHFADATLLDYNRAGTPLIEIVSYPDIRSGEEAMKYVEEIRRIVVYADVSDGKMEEGSLRCDVNISIKLEGSETLGTKVEIKNLNSIANIEHAINFEIIRQQNVLASGEKIIQETRRFDEATRQTVTMRIKTDAVDYKYFTEPNITPIKLSAKFIADAIASCPELAAQKKDRYVRRYGLVESDAEKIIADRSSASYFDECTASSKNYSMIKNWLLGDVAGYLNKNGISLCDFLITPSMLIDLLSMIEKGTISNKQARDIFAHMAENGTSASEAKQKLGIVEQLNDEDAIRKIANQVLDANNQSIIDYKNGKDRAIGFLVGQMMKLSSGKANPSLSNKVLVEELKKR